VIEHLTASLRDRTAAIDSRNSTMGDEWVARMVRFGATPILIAALLNIVEFQGANGSVSSWALRCAWFNFFLALTTLSLTFTKRFIRSWQGAAFFILSALLASNTVLGTLGGQPKLLFISLILLMVGTGSILPWPRRVQVAFIALCVGAYVTQTFWVPSLDGLGPYKLMSLLTAAAMSYFTCHVRGRFVREHEDSARLIGESEAALRQIFDANTDGITLIDSATRRIEDVNARFLSISGFRREEVIGRTTDELNVWTDPAIEQEFIRCIQRDGSITNMDVSFRGSDGRIIPSLLSSVTIVIHGKPCVMTLARDISDLRRSQEKLRESEEKFRLIFEASRDAVIVTRVSDSRVSDVNHQFIQLSGFTREEVMDRTSQELGLWLVPEQRVVFLEHLRERGFVDGLEISLRNRSGQVVPVLMSAVVVKLAGEDHNLSVVRDISRLREAEQKIRESEATQRRIFNASLDWMSIIDMGTGDYLDVNESFVNGIGYRREEIIGSNFVKLGVWPDEEEWMHLSENLVMTGEVRNQRVTFRTRDGTLVPCLVSAVQCELWGKKCCISTARDITELNQAQEKMRRSEETFRKIFDSSLDAMSITDVASGEYLDVNPEFLKSSGFSREEIVGNSAQVLEMWADPEQQQSFRRLLIEKGEVRNLQTDSRMKDGSVVTCLTSGVLAEIGGKLCCLGVTRDISELKAAEHKLRKSEATLRAIFDNSLDSISLLDLTSQTLVEVNAELTRFTGFSREEMIGKSFEQLLPTADPVRQEQLRTLLMRGGEVRNFEITLASRDGRNSPALISAAMVMIDERPHTLAVARDITDLVAAREAALAASQAKTEFLSIMSHEIRTPMNAILGMSDLIGESDLNAEQRRYLDTILRNGKALLELINSILDLAKVESGRLSLETVEFDLIELTERAADTLAVRAYEKGVELAVSFAADIPAMLSGDPHRLRQILTNLIGNAIKFTTRGEVIVTVGRNPNHEVPGEYLFKVRDTGIGIAPDKIENVFSIFTQADTSTTRKFGGSGLGLAIVQRLVALMGGRVWIESEVGRGSTFFFTADLQIPKASSIEAPTKIALDLRGASILIVIAHASTRTVAADALRARGAEVTETASEEEALAALTAANLREVRFDLLVVDSEMKSSDGYESLRRVRSLASNAPVVLLANTNGLPAKLRRMTEKGIRYYTTKPIKRQELYGVVAEALSKAAAPPRMLPTAPSEALVSIAAPAIVVDRPLKILLADDSPDNRMLIRAYMKRGAYQLTEAENGQIAVDRFMDSTYDLVLMDVQMPVLDGYGAVRVIRKWELEQDRTRTPIIALTASALDGDVQRAEQAGCDMHVSKPVKKATLLAAIAQAIEAVGKNAAIGKRDLDGTIPTPVVTANAASVPPVAFNPDFQI
jgi:PAS domain S-box-containing protein